MGCFGKKKSRATPESKVHAHEFTSDSIDPVYLEHHENRVGLDGKRISPQPHHPMLMKPATFSIPARALSLSNSTGVPRAQSYPMRAKAPSFTHGDALEGRLGKCVVLLDKLSHEPHSAVIGTYEQGNTTVLKRNNAKKSKQVGKNSNSPTQPVYAKNGGRQAGVTRTIDWKWTASNNPAILSKNGHGNVPMKSAGK